MCGSFCTHEKVLAELEKLVQLYELSLIHI